MRPWTLSEGAAGAAPVLGRRIGLVDHLEGDLAQVSEGEDLGALASIEGIEVALGCASAARTEKGVAVGAAEARSGLVTGSI